MGVEWGDWPLNVVTVYGKTVNVGERPVGYINAAQRPFGTGTAQAGGKPAQAIGHHQRSSLRIAARGVVQGIGVERFGDDLDNIGVVGVKIGDTAKAAPAATTGDKPQICADEGEVAQHNFG